MHRKHELDALFLIFYALLNLTEIGSVDCQTNAACLSDFSFMDFYCLVKLFHALMDDSCMFLREPLITNIMWRNLLMQVNALVYLLAMVLCCYYVENFLAVNIGYFL